MDFAKNAVNWGSVPDWIAGIGTILAFIGFAVAFIWEVRKRRHDDELRLLADQQAADDRRDEKARQARLIFVEVLSTLPRQVRAKVHNSSNEPIFTFKLVVLLGPAEDNIKPITAKPRQRVNGVSPHDDAEIWMELDPNEPEITPGTFVGLQIDFTDARGSRWRRLDDEQPYLIE